MYGVELYAAVGFTIAAALVHEMIEARDEKQLLRFQKRLASYKLLIIDELGFVPLSKTGAELLFEVFSQRYERGSILVTSNLPFDEWTEVFGSERLTGALLRGQDRSRRWPLFTPPRWPHFTPPLTDIISGKINVHDYTRIAPARTSKRRKVTARQTVPNASGDAPTAAPADPHRFCYPKDVTDEMVERSR